MIYCWDCDRSVYPDDLEGVLYCPICGKELSADNFPPTPEDE